MPLVRFKIRNELSLGAPELNRSAAVENEEPKAILGAVQVAGLVGILRQLGDLAEFSAEVFNGIQEEVTVTASRCQKLTSRVRRIESALSPLEKAVLSQTSHIHFAYTAGCEWHPRIRNGHNHFVQSELPLFVMETYEQCRDPPPLHLLDRFDAGGPGSCLRKYSDPTFFKKASSNPIKADDVKVQKDQARRKRKKKTLPQRNICRSHAVSTSDETNGARLSSLTDNKQTTSQSTSTVDMPRSSNMQDLSDIVDQSHLQGRSDEQEQSEAQVQSEFQESSKPRDSITGSGYIEYVINQSPVNKPEVKLLDGFASRSIQPADKIGSAVPEGCIEVVDDNILYSPSEDLPVPCASIVCDEKKETRESMVEKTSKDEEVSEIHESKFGPGTPDMVRQNQRDYGRTYILFDEVDIAGKDQSKSQPSIIDGTLGIENEGEYKSEQGSEADEFLDARNTIESESESEVDGVPKPNLEHYFGDVSTYCSEDANSDNNDGSEDIPFEEMTQESCYDDCADETFSGSYFPKDGNVSCLLSDPMRGKTFSDDETFQKPSEFVTMCPSLLAPDETVVQEESVTVRPLLAGDCADEKILSEAPVSSCPSLEDTIPAENILPEEQWVNYSFFTEAPPQEKNFPEDPIAKYPSLTEVAPNKILPEKPLPEIRPLAEALPDNKITPAEDPDAGHPSFLDTKKISVPEAVSQERISLEQSIGIYPCLSEAVPDERLLTEEPENTCPSLTKAMPIEKVLPEEPLEVNNSLAKLPEENIVQEKSDDATHPSSTKAAPEENISAEVLDSTNLSVAEAVPQEQISLGETVGINQCLTEVVPDKRFLPEEPLETYPSLAKLPEEKILHEEDNDATHPPLSQAVTDEQILPEVLDSTDLSVAEDVPDQMFLSEEPVNTYLTKAVASEKVLPEELLETYPSLAEFPEEKISHEEIGDAPQSEAVSDEKISAEVSDSTNLSLEEAVPQEQISLDETVGVNPSLTEAVPDERFITEEPVTTCPLTKAVASEKVLPEELLETYPSLSELPEEKISHEENDDTKHLYEAVSDEKSFPEVSDSTNLSSQEQIAQVQFVGTNPFSAETVTDERCLQDEPVTTCLSLTKAAAIEGVFPEKPSETYPSLADLPEEKILDEVADDASHPSLSETVSDEQISPEVIDSTNLTVEEAVPKEQISFDEIVGINPGLAEFVPDERILPEESLEMYPSLVELSEENILHEEADGTTHSSLSEAVSDEQISPEVVDSTNLPVTEAVLQEQSSLEEFVGIDPYLAQAVPDKRVFPEEPITTCHSLTKAVPVEEVLPEEPLEACGSLEILPKGKILLEKSDDDDDATHPSIAIADSDENVSLENLASTNTSVAKAIPQEQIPLEEAFVGIDPCLPEEPFEVYSSLEELPEEKILQEKEHDDAALISLENLSEEKISQEEEEHDVATHPSLGELPQEKISQEEETDEATTHPSFSEAIGDEKISPLEGPGSTYPSSEEYVPREKTSHEELVDTNMFSELAFPEEKSFSDEPGITYQSLAEAVSMPEEALPTYQSSAEAIPEEKILLEEPDATCPPPAVAVFDEKISGSEEAPGSTTETSPHNETFPEEPVAADLSFTEDVFSEKIPVSEAPGSTTETGPHNREPVATDLSLTKDVFDEKIPVSEAPGSTTETGSYNKTSHEEPVATEQSLVEPVLNDNILPKEPPAASYLALADSIPDQQVFLDDAALLSFAEAIFDQEFSPEVPDSTYPSSTQPEPSSATDQKSVESVSLWSNGGLFGLAPSKPPVFAAPNSVSEHKASDLPTRKDVSSSKSVEDTEKKNSLPLVVSSPTSQQQQQQSNNLLSHSNGSFRVFGLSHRLLMAGFRANSSSTTCKFEALPSTSYDTEVAPTEEDETRQTHFDYESSSLFRSPTSSPPVQHMKISFNNTKDTSPVSKMKLRVPSQYNSENADMFQLVPDDDGDDDDNDDESDTFCRSSSSPCVSENCLSDSELWESDESLEEQEVGTRGGEISSLSCSVLDLPCFDSVDHQSTFSRLEQEQEQEQGEVPEYIPSVSEIIRDWPPNQPKTSSSSNEANANALLKKTQNQSAGM